MIDAVDEDKTTADVETLVMADLQLSELVECMEAVEWSAVPTISTPEAAAWNARLAEARDAVREQAANPGVTADE